MELTLYLWFYLPCCFLTLGNALHCRVTLDDGQPTYLISDLPQVSAGDWDYTWANSTGYVIVHNNQKMPGLVLRYTISTLSTSRCIEELVYTGIIVSEGEHYVARCLDSCPKNARSSKDKEISRHRNAAIAATVIFVSFTLLLGLLAFLHSKFRDENSSCGCWNPPGCIFTAVKKADPADPGGLA
ncbi:uncharacterized protein AB9X84_021984 isoform 2-T2 [Acanthopagrus schlegelii]